VTMGPTRSFSSQEVEELKSYVQKGGTLIVFDGYHSETPLDPSGTAANSLLRGFDLHLNNSLLGEISYMNYTTWGYHLPYMREATIQVQPLDHPLTKDIDGKITMYSAVEVSGGEPIAQYGDTPVIAVKKVGDGQVIVVADHTVFRNFVEYEPVFSYGDPNLKTFIENLFESMGGREADGI
jgi:hypothetical protein